MPEASLGLHIDQPHSATTPAPVVECTRERISYGNLHLRLLEQYAPPSLVVNQHYDVVHVSEGARRYLQFASGEPSNNLLQLIRPELRLELHAALSHAVQRQTNVETSKLPTRIEGRSELVTIHVRPVVSHDDPTRGFLLILFAQEAVPSSEGKLVVLSETPIARQLEDEVVRLRLQLRTTSEHYELQAEELKATNEELQALNEELRSSSEELETSREELHSINEELRTVNQELKIKIDEATQHRAPGRAIA